MEPKVNTSAGPETATQTVSRITDALNNPTPTSSASSSDTAIFNALQSSLLASSDLVSSSDSGIEKAISGAVSNIKDSQAASAQRIQNEAASQSANIQRTGLINQTDAIEGRRGFATQTAVLRNILNTTNQELKDLESRKQDLLMQGEAEAASQISQLQVQSLQLAQEAKQNAVNNMINLSNSMFNFKRLQMDQEQQNRDNALGTIATLNDIGTLTSSDPQTLRNLEKAAGLPGGTLSNIPDVPTDYEIRQVGSSLLAVDPKDPTNLKVIYTAPTKAGTVSTLSIEDTQSLGLPMSLAGLSEEEVINSLGDSSAPDWYRKAEEATQLQSLETSSLNTQWNQFRATLLSRTAVPKQKEEESLVDQLLAAKKSGAL